MHNGYLEILHIWNVVTLTICTLSIRYITGYKRFIWLYHPPLQTFKQHSTIVKDFGCYLTSLQVSYHSKNKCKSNEKSNIQSSTFSGSTFNTAFRFKI